MFKKLVIKEEYAGGAISFPQPMNKTQGTGNNPLTVVYYDGDPEDLYLGTSGNFGARTRPFSVIELTTLSEDFLKYFEVVDYELTDEDVELAKEKIKSENNPLGNFLLSLLDVAEELLEVLEDEEQEEQIFNIRLPRVEEGFAFLNYDSENDKIMFECSYQFDGYQTQFTQREIDELFPEYEQFKVEVTK